MPDAEKANDRATLTRPLPSRPAGRLARSARAPRPTRSCPLAYARGAVSCGVLDLRRVPGRGAQREQLAARVIIRETGVLCRRSPRGTGRRRRARHRGRARARYSAIAGRGRRCSGWAPSGRCRR
jgi:hypothetical protein